MNCFLLLLTLLGIVYADKWAVLVVGSAGYWNYRHQADSAHAYHILLDNGYNPNNIIVLSYNDVASSDSNPFPNTLFNKPGENSINYNEGYVVDYPKLDCNIENYLKVLLGDESTGKKVLKSTEEDTVFLGFFDHGSDDLICFPLEELHSKDLLDTIYKMHEKKMYKRLVYYMEACFSGSMFDEMSVDVNAYALTAANGEESSWAYYCGKDAYVNGTSINSCLGDEFSIRWMENVDEGNLNETFKEQAELVTSQVEKSHVCRFGDFSIDDLPISEVFEGPLPHIRKDVQKSELLKAEREDIYLAKLNYYKRLVEKENSRDNQIGYQQELSNIRKIDDYFKQITIKLVNMGKISVTHIPRHVNNIECYKKSIQIVTNTLSRSDYLIKYYPTLHAFCDQFSESYLYL
ncbi:hypothetical protein WA158_001544 [Blastocystis sp. Blastoise]